MKDNIILLTLFVCLYFLVTGKGGFNDTTNARTLSDNITKLSNKIKSNNKQIKYIKRELML